MCFPATHSIFPQILALEEPWGARGGGRRHGGYAGAVALPKPAVHWRRNRPLDELEVFSLHPSQSYPVLQLDGARPAEKAREPRPKLTRRSICDTQLEVSGLCNKQGSSAFFGCSEVS